jgi:hypothetical protein
MELAHMIVDYAKSREVIENTENTCFLGVKFNNNSKYKIYIIPKDTQLIIQYNKLALLINRNREELIHVIKYFNNLISYDYSEYINNCELNQVNNPDSPDDDVSYEFTLNVGDTVIYRYLECSLMNSYSFNIDDIVTPLIYLVKPVLVDQPI